MGHRCLPFVLLLLICDAYGQTEADPPTTSSKPPSSTTAVTTTAWETETLNEGQAIQKALQYLLQHRQPDWGWGNDTHHVMLTLQLANNTGKEIEQQSLEMQLSAKQMEIEILLMMSKHHESPPPLGRLAAYTLALGALCKDPRALHGRDLVAALLHREPPHDLEFAYATLAACSSAAHVRRRHIRRLLDIANAAADHSLGSGGLGVGSGRAPALVAAGGAPLAAGAAGGGRRLGRRGRHRRRRRRAHAGLAGGRAPAALQRQAARRQDRAARERRRGRQPQARVLAGTRRQRVGRAQRVLHVHAVAGDQRHRELHAADGRAEERVVLPRDADGGGAAAQVPVRGERVAQRALRAHAGRAQGGAHGVPLLAAVPAAGDAGPGQPAREPARGARRCGRSACGRWRALFVLVQEALNYTI